MAGRRLDKDLERVNGKKNKFWAKVEAVVCRIICFTVIFALSLFGLFALVSTAGKGFFGSTLLSCVAFIASFLLCGCIALAFAEEEK